MGLEEAAHTQRQVGILRLERSQEFVTGSLRQFQGALKVSLQLRKTLGGERNDGHGCDGRRAPAQLDAVRACSRNARAKAQSRFTVALDTDSTSAVSLMSRPAKKRNSTTRP